MYTSLWGALEKGISIQIVSLLHSNYRDDANGGRGKYRHRSQTENVALSDHVRFPVDYVHFAPCVLQYRVCLSLGELFAKL